MCSNKLLLSDQPVMNWGLAHCSLSELLILLDNSLSLSMNNGINSCIKKNHTITLNVMKPLESSSQRAKFQPRLNS